MKLELARQLHDPLALWEELEALWGRGALVGLATPQERAQLTAAVLDAAAAGRELRRPTPPHDRRESPWGPALVLGSGGSSGGRRWCLQPLNHLQASAQACGDWLRQLGIDPRHCLHLDALPLHHVSGLMPLIRARQWRAELRWLPAELLREPALLAQACPLPSDRSVLLSLVPTQLHRLLVSPEALEWLKGCALIWVGGAAMTDDLAARARKAQLPLAPCYGATETAAMICALPPQRFLAGEPGCGPPLDDVTVRLEGAAGAIAVRSRRLSPGWFEAGTLRPFTDQDGWWRSGDAGGWSTAASAAPSTLREPPSPGIAAARPPANGGPCSLVVHGRLDGAMHSGGETVFPEQVRQRLLELIRTAGIPVRELLLLAETDARWGERLVALVRWESAHQPGTQGRTDVQRFTRLADLARALPPSQRPRRWLSCPSLRPSETGKWELATWRRWLSSHATSAD